MYTLYCYPKCSTCRKAQKWLDQEQVDYQFIDVVKEPPTEEKLAQWITNSGLPVRRFFNTSGVKYRELGLKDRVADLTVAQASQLLASEGMLIKRPLIVEDQQFVINGFNESKYEGVVKR